MLRPGVACVHSYQANRRELGDDDWLEAEGDRRGPFRASALQVAHRSLEPRDARAQGMHPCGTRGALILIRDRPRSQPFQVSSKSYDRRNRETRAPRRRQGTEEGQTRPQRVRR